MKFNILCLRRPCRRRPTGVLRSRLRIRGTGVVARMGSQLSVVFADGRTSMRRSNWEPGSVPTAPVLVPSGGTTSYEKWNYSYWLWPLPPPGDLTFVCKWQAIGIPESRTIVDATVIVEAAAQAIRLWPDDGALQSREKERARSGTGRTGLRPASGPAQTEVSVREFSVRTRGYDFDHVVWLDEASGAFRFSTADERPDGYASVFDGVCAATRLGRCGPRLVRYEGSPAVVARLAGSLSVTAAFAVVRGEVITSTMTVTEVHDPEAVMDGRVFALPTGDERRVVRQVDPITREAVGRGYWLGERWDGTPPDFAAVSVAGDYSAVFVVYPGVSIITSAAEPGKELIGEPVSLGGRSCRGRHCDCSNTAGRAVRDAMATERREHHGPRSLRQRLDARRCGRMRGRGNYRRRSHCHHRPEPHTRRHPASPPRPPTDLNRRAFLGRSCRLTRAVRSRRRRRRRSSPMSTHRAALRKTRGLSD